MTDYGLLQSRVVTCFQEIQSTKGFEIWSISIDWLKTHFLYPVIRLNEGQIGKIFINLTCFAISFIRNVENEIRRNYGLIFKSSVVFYWLCRHHVFILWRYSICIYQFLNSVSFSLILWASRVYIMASVFVFNSWNR